MKPIVFNDESIVNDYGFRILNAGIQTSRFLNNPIMLYIHQRGSKWDAPDRTALPIGKVENIRIEGSKYVGDPVFDTNDEFAKKIADKWENGFLNMGSIGAEPVTTSSDPQFLLPGQLRETVVTCTLLEISVADIGGNEGCVALYNKEGIRINLSQGNENPIPEIQTEPTNNHKTMKKIALLLSSFGIAITDSENEDSIVDAIKPVLEDRKNKIAELSAIRDGRIIELVGQAITDKKFTEDKKDHFIELGRSIGPDRLKTTIDLMPVASKPTEHINLSNGSQAGEGGEPKMTFDDLKKKGVEAIELFKKEHPKEYIALYKEKFGVAPQDKTFTT